ncbi:helix-turn-helix domain-containing protein [Streptomyces sp. SID3343]|nr:helix-turn-helix domain-containing protein [Streptomyces sp. SID3343]
MDYRRCAYCGRWFRQDNGPGRKRDYCDKPCRRRAQRLRDGKGVPAARSRWRGADAVEEVLSTTMRLAEAEYRNAPLPVTLDHVHCLASALDRYTEAAVRDALASGIGWDAIAAATDVDVNTARTKWGTPRARHPNRRHLRGEPAREPAPAGERTSPPHGDASEAPEADGEGMPTSAGRAARELAAALTRLRGASGSTVSDAASRAGLTPSYVSLVLSGDVRPPWTVVAVLAEIFSGEPEALLALWGDAQATVPSPGSAAPPAEALGRGAVRVGPSQEGTPDGSADLDTPVPRVGPRRIETEDPGRPGTDR